MRPGWTLGLPFREGYPSWSGHASLLLQPESLPLSSREAEATRRQAASQDKPSRVTSKPSFQIQQVKPSALSGLSSRVFWAPASLLSDRADIWFMRNWLLSFLRKRGLREKTRGRKQEENVRDRSCRRDVGTRKREPGGSYRKCLGPTSSQIVPKVCTECEFIALST